MFQHSFHCSFACRGYSGQRPALWKHPSSTRHNAEPAPKASSHSFSEEQEGTSYF